VATFIGNDLTAYASDIGHDEFTLGFVNSTGACAPVWSTDEGTLRSKVTALRAAGGDVIVSSGGWNAVDLVRQCSTAQAAADAYQLVLDAFSADHLDLDPEHGDQQNNLEPAIVDRRNDALKLLQDAAKARGATLRVSFTLGVSPATGFSAENLYVLQSALQRGVEIDVVNPMTMDFYDGVSGSAMGAASIQALRSVHAQLKTLYPARTDAQLWGMLAATPMIGQNDNPQEVFTLADAQLLVDFARTQGMARLSFWATSRDNGGCPGQTTASASCSGVSQAPYAFSSIFKGLAQ
jgi:chitinase